MEIEFLGGPGEIGRSAILIDDTLLLDFGMDSGNPPAFAIGRTQEVLCICEQHGLECDVD